MNLEEIKRRLEEIETKPLKQFGQNFLMNEGVIQKIVFQVKKKESPYIEIGPGLGSLTEHFDNTHLTLIEKDKKFASYWKQKGFQVHSEDALKLDWPSLGGSINVFGNLPYQIAGSLVLELSLSSQIVSQMVFMMQKEVAQRILSKSHSKNYGILSVISQVFWEVQNVVVVNKKDFYPAPKVDGQVLAFSPKKDFPFEAKEFLLFVKACFSQRRKKLIKQIPCDSLDKVKQAFIEMNLDLQARAEELSPDQFIEIHSRLRK